MVKKIALEEHFMSPGLEEYWRPTMSLVPPEVFKPIYARLTDFGELRLREMDAAGIVKSVLSIAGPGVQIEPDAKRATYKAAESNDFLAAEIQKRPRRYDGFAQIALQDPKAAAAELERCVKQLGFKGCMINGQTLGHYLDERQFDPFWAKAAELGTLVFMHPNGSANLLKSGALAGRGGLGNVVGNPLETTVFLSRLILDGTFDKFPTLRVCGAHGGGFLPSYFGRTEVACQRPNANCGNTKRPSEYLRQNLLADTMVFSEEGLRHLVAEMGVSQVVYGTDVPFNWPVTVDLILDSPSLKDADKEAILGGNLLRLLKIPAA